MPREKPTYRAALDRLDNKYPDKEFLSGQELADYLGVSRWTVLRNWEKCYNKTVRGYVKTKIATRVIGNVGLTRMNRAAAALWAGNIEPTRGYKLRRFIKRLVWTFNAKMDEASRIAYSTDTPAAEVPFIGLIGEHV